MIPARVKQWFLEFDDPDVALPAPVWRWAVFISFFVIPLAAVSGWRRREYARMAFFGLTLVLYYLMLPVTAPVCAWLFRSEMRSDFGYRG